MRRPRILSSLFLLLCIASCGEPGGVDRSHYQPVFDAAMRALAASDLETLDGLLSSRGRRNLQETLRDFQHRLQDPVQGPRILQLAEERRGPIGRAEIETAAHGSLEDVWAFLLRSDPRPPVPAAQTPHALPGGDTVIVEYADPRGTLRTVTLRVREGVWAVDDLQL